MQLKFNLVGQFLILNLSLLFWSWLSVVLIAGFLSPRRHSKLTRKSVNVSNWEISWNFIHFMNGKNGNSEEIDSLYFVPDNFLFPNIFSSIFIKKGRIQQNFAPPYICWENTTKTVLLCEGWKYALSVQRMTGVFISDASELWTLKGRVEGL